MKKLIVLLFAAALTGHAQIVVIGQQSADKSNSTAQVAVTTSDRTVVPVTVATTQTAVNDTTTRAVSTTQVRLNDGTYFDWRKSVTETQKNPDGTGSSTTEIVETDRQGKARVSSRTTEVATRMSDGSLQVDTAVTRRNSNGNAVLDRQTVAHIAVNPDGSTTSTSIEKRADVNGVLRPERQIQERTTNLSPTESTTERTIRNPDHLDGGLTVSARELITTRTNGGTTTSETMIQKPAGAGWQNTGRVITSETKATDGSVQRETLEAGTSINGGTLVPQRKTVEKEVRQADGTVLIQQDVYRRDVNGDWKPVTFGTDQATSAY